jgi:hypothetical protein
MLALALLLKSLKKTNPIAISELINFKTTQLRVDSG